MPQLARRRTLSCPSASASAAFLGPTTLATLWYESIALTQLARPYAALDTFRTFLGSNSSRVMMGCSFLMISGSMLSLSKVLRESRK